MIDPTHNEGIVQSEGGQIINFGAMAVGRRARAAQHQAETERALRQLEALRALLAEHAPRLPAGSHAEAEAAVSEVADELDSPDPDRTRLSAAVSRLSGLVASVVPLAHSAESLTKAIENLAH
jgi:hypothetical protein